MTNSTNAKAPKFLRDAVDTTSEITLARKAVYAQNGNRENQLAMINAEQREITAKTITSDALISKELYKRALGKVAEAQLDASQADNYKSLRRLNNYMAAFAANDPNMLSRANAEVLQAFKTATKSYKTLSDVANSCYMKGQSQATNAIRSLVFLGILETEDTDAPQYIKRVSQHSYRIAQSNLQEAKQAKSIGKSRATKLLA